MTFSPELITAIGSGISALGAIIIAIINGVKCHKLDQRIEQAKLRETYCICPKCKKRIPLSEIQFRLPDGSLDNNLNGKPDILE